MSRLTLAAAGAAVGFAIGGPTGAQIGWAVGSMVGGTFEPNQKSEGPRLGDLAVSGSSYGTPIPWVAGSPRVAGQVVWASSKREIATTQTQGKGGGGGQEYTSYTYEVDLLILLSDNQISGVSRVWLNGELAWAGVGLRDPLWSRMTVYGGEASQLPDPTYEAAVGTANAPAYRGRGTVMIQGLQLGGSGQIPNITFEINATTPVYPSGATVLMLRGDGAAGSTAIVDSSGYARTIASAGVTNEPDILTADKGSLKFTGGGGLTVSRQTPDYGLDFGKSDFTLEAWVNLSAVTIYGQVLFSLPSFSGNPGNSLYLHAYYSFGNTLYYSFSSPGGSGSSGDIGGGGYAAGTRFHLCLMRVGIYMQVFVNGTFVGNLGIFGSGDVSYGTFNIGSGLTGAMDEVRISRGRMYTLNASGNFLAPSPPLSVVNDYVIGARIYNSPTVKSVVESACQLSGLSASQMDTTALSAITPVVRGLSVARVSNARNVLQVLGQAYNFDVVLSDKLYFRLRGQSAVGVIPFEDLGCDGADPLTLRMVNEMEVPAQLAITYSNVDNDHQSDTQYSDRLISGQESTSAVQLPLVLTASEAKAMADAQLMDKVISMTTTTIAVGLKHSNYEPTDVLILTGDDASTWRTRVVKKSEQAGVVKLDLVLDDASVFTQAGVTTAGDQGQTAIYSAPGSSLMLLDIALLQDSDNGPGHYAAIRGDGARWQSASLYQSRVNNAYNPVGTVFNSGNFGTCLTALTASTAAGVFDEASAVTVSVGQGQLASATRKAMLDSPLVNAALIGSELVQYRTATLVSAGVYTLSGFLRGRRGTEWAMGSHAAGEAFCVIGVAGMLMVPLQSADLGKPLYYKAASAGQRLSAVAYQTITPTGVLLKPFSPVDCRANRTTTDTVLTWKRRTRLAPRFVGTLGINVPLGEAAESYEVEVYSSAAFTTLKRTIAGLSSATATYTSAQQVADFGTNQSVMYLKIYQLSATVGRGYALTVTV